MKKFGFATIITGGIVAAFLGLGAPAQAIASPADAVTLSSDFQNPNSGSDHGTWPAQDGTNTPIMLPNGDVHPSH